MSYNYVIGRTCQEWAIGKQWTFGKFTRLIWEEIAQEARKLMPDPIDVLGDESYEKVVLRDAEIIRKLQIADAAELAKAKSEGRAPALMAPQYSPVSRGLEERAYIGKSRYLSAGSPELNGFLMSNEGQGYLFYLLLRAAHADITPEEGFDIYWDLSVNNGKDGRKTPDQIVNICNGRAPESPKNEAAPA